MAAAGWRVEGVVLVGGVAEERDDGDDGRPWSRRYGAREPKRRAGAVD